jgi:spoIIIJ-associated protein
VTDTSIPRAEQPLDEEIDPIVVSAQDDTDIEDEADEAEADEDEADEAEGAEVAGAATDTELFRQSEIAADYVEGLLDILDYDGDIDELVSAGRPVVEVVGGRLQPLVGQRGSTLEALQELTRLAVFRQTGSPSRLLLDVGGYRATRRKELAAVAKNAVEKVKEYGEPVRLEPMSAFERKCVHDVVNALAGVESESEGVEPNRRIVVRPVD